MMLGLYFDQENNIILNPELLDPAGFGRASKRYMKLEHGWSESELAESIMKGLSISEENNLEDANGEKFWIAATGIKGFAAFSKKHRHVFIEVIKEESCYFIHAYKRCKDGSYGIDKDEEEIRSKSYSGVPKKETIVGQVMEALKLTS